MSGIKAFELSSSRAILSGTLSCRGGLSGTITIPAQYSHDPYVGDYEIAPNAYNTQTLPTANKLLKNDVVIKKVPYFETGNAQDGVTVYIGEEG